MEEWPRYVREVISPQLQSLLLGQFAPQIENIPISVTYDRCHNKATFQLKKEDIAELFAHSSLNFACAREGCVEGIRNKHQTLKNVSLGEILLQVINRQTIAKLYTAKTDTPPTLR